MLTDPYDREIDKLERELEDTDDPEERRLIRREIREVAREANEEESWREEGELNGWL